MKKKNTGKSVGHGKEDSAMVKVENWMHKNNLRMVKIAKKYGCGRAFGSQFIHGLKTSKGFAKFMIDLGCPAECFENGKIVQSPENKAV